MNTLSYYQFNHPDYIKSDKDKKSNSTLEDFIINALKALIPVGNPDFQDQLKRVESWLVEYDHDSKMTTREIGLNNKGEVLFILPLEKNLGYWSNDKRGLLDFEEIELLDYQQSEFENKWNHFHQK
ncbi:MAG: hypothetical protein ACPG6V_00765 [Flavobacteriales bacterium]